MRLSTLCERFFSSPEFQRLASSTQKFYKYGARDLPSLLLCKNLDELQPTDIRAIKSLDLSPSKISRCLATFRRLEGWAVEREVMTKRLSIGIHFSCHSTPHRAWTLEELEAFDAIDPSPVKGLFSFAYYTAQRKSDLFAARWDDVTGESWHLQQQKTKRNLIIPLPQFVQSALARPAVATGAILADRFGTAISAGALTHQWNKQIKQLGLSGCTLHGLRVTRAVHLAEAGCSTHEIAAVTGHKSLRMVQHYTRDANQAGMAAKAIQRISSASLPFQLANPSNIIRNNKRRSRVVGSVRALGRATLRAAAVYLGGMHSPSYA